VTVKTEVNSHSCEMLQKAQLCAGLKAKRSTPKVQIAFMSSAKQGVLISISDVAYCDVTRVSRMTNQNVSQSLQPKVKVD
jgi:hypothetical protein